MTPVLQAALGALQSRTVNVAEQEDELPHPSFAVNTVVKVPGPAVNGPKPAPSPGVLAVNVTFGLQSVAVGVGIVNVARQLVPSMQTFGAVQLVITGATKSTKWMVCL